METAAAFYLPLPKIVRALELLQQGEKVSYQYLRRGCKEGRFVGVLLHQLLRAQAAVSLGKLMRCTGLAETRTPTLIIFPLYTPAVCAQRVEIVVPGRRTDSCRRKIRPFSLPSPRYLQKWYKIIPPYSATLFPGFLLCEG